MAPSMMTMFAAEKRDQEADDQAEPAEELADRDGYPRGPVFSTVAARFGPSKAPNSFWAPCAAMMVPATTRTTSRAASTAGRSCNLARLVSTFPHLPCRVGAAHSPVRCDC